MLHGKLDGYQKRIAELEDLLLGFKKDQERIEQGIISALDRLNHFEDAVDVVSDGGVVSGGDAEPNADAASLDDVESDDGAAFSDDTDADAVSLDDAAPDGGAAFDGDVESDADAVSLDDAAPDGGAAFGGDAESDADAISLDDAAPDDGAARGNNAEIDLDAASLDDDTAPNSGTAAGNGAAFDFNADSLDDDTAPNGVTAAGGDTAFDFNADSFNDDTAPNGVTAAGGGTAFRDDGTGLDFDTGSPGGVAFNETASSGGTENEGEIVPPVLSSASADLSFPLEREMSYGESGELENSDEMADLDGDEFLDALKSDRISVPEPVAAFSDELLAEDSPEKTRSGPELDIF
jgi:hypothetical protein